MTTHENTTLAGSWSADGRDVLATVIDPETRGDIAVVTPEAPDGIRTLVDTMADEYSPQFSPDGRWLAYYAFDAGGGAVYVQSYPDLEIKELAGVTGSDNDGEPVWSRDGRELFFWRGSSLMVVPVELGESISIGRARELLQFREIGDLEGIAGYDVAPDGSRFVMVRRARGPATSSGQTDIQVVLDWTGELERMVPRR